MTKSTITRERAQQIFLGNGPEPSASEERELARMALAAMDSEPVAWLLSGGGAKNVVCFDSGNAYADPLREVTPLYRHAQPAKTVQPVMFIDGDISSEDADKLAKVIREFNEEDERPLAKMARIIRENPHPTNECDIPKAQSAPVVLDEVTAEDCPAFVKYDVTEVDEAWARGFNSCRAAMLSGSNGRKKTRVIVLGASIAYGVNSLMSSGCSPVIPDGYVMVPKEPTDEMLAAAKEWTGLTSTAEVVYIKMLAAAPQEAINALISVVSRNEPEGK